MKLGKPNANIRQTASGILIRDGQLLLGKRAPHRTICPNCWDFFGGHLEPGETISEALVRELIEELAVTAMKYCHLATLIDVDLKGTVTYHHHIFGVTNWNGTGPQLVGDEHTEMRWFGLTEVANLNLAYDDYIQLIESQF